MLDITFIRDNKELIEEAVKKRRMNLDIGQLISLDDKRRALQQEVDNLRAKQNTASGEIAQMQSDDERQQKITESKQAKEALQEKEKELKKAVEKWKELMIRVPNIPDMSVPIGDDESGNQDIKQVGDKPSFSFEPKDHIQLALDLGIADFERGAKVHGFRGYFLKGDGALLSHALWDYARDFFLKKNFEYFLPPTIVNKEYLYGTGHLPSDAEDLFMTQDEQYLAGTSEISLMAYHGDETLSKEELPKRYLAFSPCYRREAGSYGKDTKGLYRVHEFYKLEQVVLCEASHEMSVEIHEELQRNHEEFIESLGLPYQQTVICTGDLKAGQVKCYDTELWIPSQKRYGEIASASYYHDFQSRRFNIRYADHSEDGRVQKQYVHSLNATAIPTPRILIALLENNQQADGSVVVPEVLRPYLGGRDTIRPRP